MNKSESIDQLFQAILSLESVEECYQFFEDACTIKEIRDMAGRFQVACMLNDKKSYVNISQETGVATATISRVNRSLQYGNGGYQLAINRLKEEK